jgi:hypothetical protein
VIRPVLNRALRNPAPNGDPKGLAIPNLKRAGTGAVDARGKRGGSASAGTDATPSMSIWRTTLDR